MDNQLGQLETAQAERRDRMSTNMRQDKQKDETGRAEQRDRTSRKMRQDDQKDQTGQAQK